MRIGQWNFSNRVTSAIVLDDLEAGDAFAFGVFDGEIGVVFGPADEFPKTVFTGTETEEHGVVFMGTGYGSDVEVVKGVGVRIARGEAVADEQAERAVDGVLGGCNEGLADPLVGEAGAGDFEEEFLREAAEVRDVFCAVTDAEDFESGAIAEIEGG